MLFKLFFIFSCLFLMSGYGSPLPSLVSCQEGERLIEFSRSERKCLGHQELMLLQEERTNKTQLGVGFMDVTNFPHSFSTPEVDCSAFPKEAQQVQLVTSLLPNLNKQNVYDLIGNLSNNFKNRYYNGDLGVKAAEFLKTYIENMVATYKRDDVTVEFFSPHPDTKQASVVTTIPGSSPDEPIVVLGAHEDSISGMFEPQNNRAPGADDDASGVSNLMEVLRVLLQSNYKPKRTMKFMCYAGEEGGLLGSQDIASDFKKNKAEVFAVLQIEMSGYLADGVKDSPSVVFINDDGVSPCLVSVLQLLAKQYLTVPFRLETCEYGCSDHVSWTKEGYASCCIAEAGPHDQYLNPNMHSSNDVLDILNMDYCMHFTRLSLAFAIELSSA